MAKAIIFDFDGTLFHSKGLGKKSLKKVCKKFGKEFDEQKYADVEGLNRSEKIKLLFPDDFEKMWPVWDKEYSERYLDEALPYGGAIELLKNLKEKGYLLFIFSTKISTLIEETLERNGIRNLFSEVIGFESIPNPKPAKDGIELIMKKYSLEKSDLVLVGDSWVDEKAAENAGIEAIIVPRGEISNIGKILE